MLKYLRGLEMKYAALSNKNATVQSMGVRNQTSCIICMLVTHECCTSSSKKYMIFSAVFSESARYYVYLGVVHGVYTESKDARPRKI